MGMPSITEKGRNGTGAGESSKYNSQKFLRTVWAKFISPLFPNLGADMTALM